MLEAVLSILQESIMQNASQSQQGRAFKKFRCEPKKKTAALVSKLVALLLRTRITENYCSTCRSEDYIQIGV